MLAVLDLADARLNQLPQRLLALQQGQRGKIATVEMEDVERDEHQPARLVPDRGFQRREIGSAPLVGYNDLAVENGGPAWQLDCQRDGPVFCGPVMAVLAVKTHAAFIDDDL